MKLPEELDFLNTLLDQHLPIQEVVSHFADRKTNHLVLFSLLRQQKTFSEEEVVEAIYSHDHYAPLKHEENPFNQEFFDVINGIEEK